MNREEILELLRDELKLEIETIYGSYGERDMTSFKLVLGEDVICERYL